MLSNSEGGILSSPQKLIGGGLIGLILFGLVIAFVTAPTGLDMNHSNTNNNANTNAMSKATSFHTDAADADTDAETAAVGAAGAPHLSGPDEHSALPHAHSAASSSSSSRMRLQVEPTHGVHRPPPVLRALPPNVVRALNDAAASAASAASAADSHIAGADDTGADGDAKAAAAADDAGDEMAADKTLTFADAGSSVTLKIGQKLALRLKENRTTGYGWQLEDRDDPTKHGLMALPNDSPLALLSDKSVKPQGLSLPRRIGAGGEHVFVFEAKAAGTADVFATYRRPWLTPSSAQPVTSFTVHVTVEAADA